MRYAYGVRNVTGMIASAAQVHDCDATTVGNDAFLHWSEWDSFVGCSPLTVLPVLKTNCSTARVLCGF